MSKPRSYIAPTVAALLLLIPPLYVGSYFALVIPEGWPMDEFMGKCERVGYYRVGKNRTEMFFWPLEKLDRRARPHLWNTNWVL